MRRITSELIPNEKKFREIIRDEIEKTKPRWAYKMEYDLNEKIEGLATHTEVAKFKDEVLTALDGVMGELKAIREEQTFSSSKLSEHSDCLESHETRLTKLESPTSKPF